MNILQILPELKSGGVERGTVDFAKFLKRQGHKSVVVSAGGPLVDDLVAAGVVHYALPVHRKSLFSIIRSVRELSRIVKNEEIQLMHARSRVPALIALFVSRKTQLPFVTTCHGFYRGHFLSRVMGWGKYVIVASHIIGERMRDNFGVGTHRLRYIPRGVNLEEFSPKPEARPAGGSLVIGIVGRLTPIKGHPLFLKAVARVVRVYPNVKIQIIGDSPKPQYKEELVGLVRRLGLSEVVEFLGTRYDIPELMSRMRILAVPSVGEEAFGRVVIEAGACRLPVVATRMGGIVDILEHEINGLLVPADDPRNLADAMLRLLREPELAERLAAALHEKVNREYGMGLMFERTLKVYEEAVGRQRILVIKLSAVGDVILSIPSIRAIRQKYPDAWITVLVGRKSRRIIRNCPYVNDVLVHEDAPGLGRVSGVLRTARLLAAEGFDMVLDLQNNKVSHALSFLCGARIRAGHGHRRWSFLLNRRTQADATVIAPLEHQFQAVKLLGVDSFEKRLELWTRKEEDEKIKALLESAWVAPSQAIVGINPGSSPRWTTKQWPVENFAKLCDELTRRNIQVVITGTGEDRPVVEALMGLVRQKPISLVGKTSITELVALVRRCQVFISSDSAPMHVAASLEVPLLAIFGPTDPRRHLVPPADTQVFWKQVPCSPCYLRNCPIGLVCMKKISVQEVLDATLHFVHLRRPRPAEEVHALKA